MTLSSLVAFAFACFVIVIVPGPTVTVIIANSLRDGARAGWLNIAGTQVGLAIMLGIVALGLDAVVGFMADAFVWVKLAGAAYLIWLGINLLRSDGALAEPGEAQKRPRAGYFWQGFFVIWSNPKALLFFGAFIPQFVDPAHDALPQVLVLGLIFMIVATIFDGMYALLAARARGMLRQTRVRLVERASGSFLIGGGIWLAALQRN